jgi:LysM repeat protein
LPFCFGFFDLSLDFTFQKMGCLKIDFYKSTELKVVHVSKNLTSEKSKIFERKDYSYGFNTQESSPEIQDNHFTALFWEYDARSGRRWNLDPVVKIWESGYACLSNNPIQFNDVNGDDPGDPVKHTVQKGETLGGIAKKYQTTVQSLAEMNEIKDHNKINVGDNLKVSNYSWNSEQDKNANGGSNLKPSGSGTSPGEDLETPWGALVDGAGDFGERGEKLTKGTTKNGVRYYANGWNGNQYTRTTRVFSKQACKKLAGGMPVIGTVLDGTEIVEGFQKDGYTVGKNTKVQTLGAVAGAGGAAGGGVGCAALGTMFCPGIGTVIGGVIGTFVFSWGAEAAAEAAAEKLIKE